MISKNAALIEQVMSSLAAYAIQMDKIDGLTTWIERLETQQA